MKNALSILFAALFTSALLIGCDFVDSNSAYVEMEEPAQVEASYDGYFTTQLDTMGYEDYP